MNPMKRTTNPHRVKVERQQTVTRGESRIPITFRKEEPAKFVATSEAAILVPAMAASRDEAQRIVAYPEDYGMNRNQVRRLERMIAARNGLLRGEAAEATEATPPRTCEPRRVRLQLVKATGPRTHTTPEWRREAQQIVAYPGDYGMARDDVRGLERMLAGRLEPVVAPVPEFLRRRFIGGDAARSVEELTRPAA